MPLPNLPSRIRVMLVDDSPLALELIGRALAVAPDIEVVGTASNGLDALNKIPVLAPQVVCTDFHMPRMDGLQLTKEIMQRHPLPVLVMSGSLQPDQQDNIFAMLEAGALDVLAKPIGGKDRDMSLMVGDLIYKIRVLSGVKVFRRFGDRPAGVPATGFPGRPRPDMAKTSGEAARIVGIGASTGGPLALETILGALPEDFPLPIVCVQHISHGFVRGLADWLNTGCKLHVCIAQEGTVPQPGVVYFAGDNRHLELDNRGRFKASKPSVAGGHCPSVDVALSSLARCHRSAVVGILLTGMGEDGARGLLEINRAGGFTIAQNEESSVVFGMPKAAIDLGAADRVLPVSDIAGALQQIVESR